MKKKEKALILILVVITIAVIVIAVCVNKKDDSNEAETNSAGSSSSVETSISEEEEEEIGEYAILSEDGTKINTSSTLSETKTIGGIEITNIQLTENDNVTQLLATMTNTSDETEGGYIAVLKLYDEGGNVLIEMNPYIAELEPGESTQLNTSAVFDYAEAYDFSIEKQ